MTISSARVRKCFKIVIVLISAVNIYCAFYYQSGTWNESSQFSHNLRKRLTVFHPIPTGEVMLIRKRQSYGYTAPLRWKTDTQGNPTIRASLFSWITYLLEGTWTMWNFREQCAAQQDDSACSAYIHGYILSTSYLVAYVLDKILNKFFPLNVY